MPPRVLHLSTYDSNGGAARAASTLHQAMVQEGIDSLMVVGARTTSDPTVRQVNSIRFRAARLADRQLWRLQRSPVETWRSPARFSAMSAKEINESGADIVHLHWVTDGFLSIEELGKIRIPVVWSMYDMWPLTGTEHYGVDSLDARWRVGYAKDNRPSGETGFDLDRWTFERKRVHWEPFKSRTVLVPASTWLMEATSHSTMMENWTVRRVPHVVNTDFFRPMNQAAARLALNFHTDDRIVLFLASAGIGDRRKGWDLLVTALPKLAKGMSNIRIVVVGPRPSIHEQQASERAASVPIHWFGTASSSHELLLLYNAASVTVVPSREDNMPLTAMEAQSCGCPVVGFRTGGLSDIVVPRVSGYLAKPEDTEDLAAALHQSLTCNLRATAQSHAEATWSPNVVVPQIEEIYRRLQ